MWAYRNNTNAVPGPASQHSFIISNIQTPSACFNRCQANATCDVWAWSPHSHNCYFRLDHRWAPGSPNVGYVSGCIQSGPRTVWGCAYDPTTSACPSHFLEPASKPAAPPIAKRVLRVKARLGAQIGRTSGEFRMLGVNFDFWPPEKAKWGTCGVLTSRLDDPHLLRLAARLNGSLLRIGGSPADFMLYDVFDGACSAANLNRTQPHPKKFQPKTYFCPIWDQVRGQCLSMSRWREINRFALTSGLRIAFDLNGCWGRANATAEMDFRMISGLFNVTARMAANGTSAVYAFQFTNEVYGKIAPARYGSDLLRMRKLLDEAWARHAPAVAVAPTLMGPDNGWEDMSAEHLDTVLSVSAGVMAAATYHDYQNPCVDKWHASGLALNATCLDAAMHGALDRFGAICARHRTPLWLTESALHAGSGVDGVTNVFTSSLWYAHALGQLARNGVGLLSRQTLLGGDYELINRTTGAPNPDYYVALLWHDLVGSEVHEVTLGGDCATPTSECAAALRLHAHRAVDAHAAAVVVVIINFSLEAAFEVALSGSASSARGERWLLAGQPSDNHIYLNGQPLVYVPGSLPPLPADDCDASRIAIPPAAIVFCKLPMAMRAAAGEGAGA